MCHLFCKHHFQAIVKRRHLTNFCIFVSILTVYGCVSLQIGKGDKVPDYSFPNMAGEWKPIDVTSNVKTFRSEKSASIIGLTAACDGAQDSSFETLLGRVTSAVPHFETIDDIQPVVSTPLPSRFTKVKGEVEGTKIEMFAVVLKSVSCVYDITMTGDIITAGDESEALRIARNLKKRTSKW